jgi:hypothetical protein
MTDFDDTTTEEHERRIVRCREQTCVRGSFGSKRPRAKTWPVDADTVEPDDTEYDGERHISHFKTCKTPNRFSGSQRR